MNTETPDVPDGSGASRVYHVGVLDDGRVEVSGGTPQEVIDLLHAAGNQIIVDEDMLTTAVPDPDAIGDPDGLSERELQVLALIATGLTNTEVADEVYLSINTIKSYIRSCYRKIGVHSRSQAVIWAIDHGVVDAHPDHD